MGRSGDHQGEQSSAVDGLERALVTAGLARHPIVRPWQESGSCSVRATAEHYPAQEVSPEWIQRGPGAGGVAGDGRRVGGGGGMAQERGTTSAGSPVGSGGSVRSGKSAPEESAITTSTPSFRDSSTDSDSSSPSGRSPVSRFVSG